MSSLDPSVAMALAVHAHKGIYALLLGSGVSRSAGMPTGWDVVRDLASRVAALEDANADDDMEAWYRSRFKKEPNYSELIQMLAPTRAERMSLLRGYFEPTPEERENGMKTPTPAHRAIARLVVSGHVRVIITTNFDRLMEQALQQQQINPTVVSSSEDIAGMMPLPHVPCLVVKVHGDYLDTRIRNTPDELESYETPMVQLLDRLLVEHGLIVCGWSVDWDPALANAVRRTARHQFSTFWLSKGKLSQPASDLISKRLATVVQIESADAAFAALADKVHAADQQRLLDPASPQLAIAMMKRFLAEDRYRIALTDFVMKEAFEVRRQASSDRFPADSPQPTTDTFRCRVEQIEVICAKLVPTVATGVYWGTDTADELWKRCIEALGRVPQPASSYRVWEYLRYYPATLVFYAAVLTAIVRRRWCTLRSLMEGTLVGSAEKPVAAGGELNPLRCLQHDAAQWLHGGDGKTGRLRTPSSDWMVQRLQPMLIEVLGEDVDFENLFDEAEFLLALQGAFHGHRCAVGRFGWRRGQHGENELVVGLRQELDAAKGDDHRWLAAGMFGGRAENLRNALARVEKVADQVCWG